MRHRLALLAATALAMLLASSPALALDQEDLDTLSRHGAASFEAFAKFGDVGETLTHIGSSKFSGTGSQRRAMARQVDNAMQPWRDASAAAKGSLSYKLVPSAMLATDIATSFIAPTMEGDIRGAVSGAVNIAVAPTVVGSFTAIGTGAGAMLGSFVPVVGNALGGMVGGAVGTVAGGYISAYAYDKYVKELVSKAVEGGIAAVFDTSPLQQAMQARQAFLHENASPEVKADWDRMNAVSRSFGGGEGQVLDWERLPYVVTPMLPTPDAEQQAALGDGLPASFVLNQSTQTNYPLNCTIKDAQVTCSGQHSQGSGTTLTISLAGTVSGNTLEVENFTVFEAATGCTSRAEYRGRDKIVLEAGGRAAISGSHTATQTLRGVPCPTGPTTWSNSYSGVGTWRAVK